MRESQKNIFKVIRDSINKNLLLKIRYANARGETADRIIEPMTLLFMGYSWYLFAYCRLRGSFRLFRLSRIREALTLQESFVRKEASYSDYIKYEKDERPMAHLVLKFSPEAGNRVHDYFGDEQIEMQDNGDIVVRVSYPEDEWVYSSILGFGEHVEVLEPFHIREIIKNKAKKILSRYKPDTMVSQD